MPSKTLSISAETIAPNSLAALAPSGFFGCLLTRMKLVAVIGQDFSPGALVMTR